MRVPALLLPEVKNLLAVCFICLTVFNSLIFVLTLFTAFRVNRIAERKTTFAQLVNGETIYVSEQERHWRYPSVIQKVVSDWTTLTFNWDEKIPGTNEPDQGVRVGNRGKGSEAASRCHAMSKTLTTKGFQKIFAILLKHPENDRLRV
ncbi:MAG: hypothetical protein KME27_19185, partial [Lyngbya sp. HA4199-MV5]|nr:hypothetical protein [Lyngbya sp. HA4199-MV5]